MSSGRLGSNLALVSQNPLNGLTNEITDNDPFVGYTSTRDSGAGLNNSLTGPGRSLASTTTTIDGGATSGITLRPKEFNFNAYQRLVVSGYIRDDASRTSFDNDPVTGVNTASMRQNNIVAAGFARFYNGRTYLDLALSGDWGRGTFTDNIGTSSGRFNTQGYSTFGGFGHTTVLYHSAWDTPYASGMPTKAKVRDVPNNAVLLDTSLHVGYAKETVGGYTDAGGVTYGDQNSHYWDLALQAKLYANYTVNKMIWTPFVAATFDQQFGLSNVLNIPVQTALLAGGSVGFGSAQTFGGLRAGLSVQSPGGLIFGLQGLYRQSSQFSSLGGQAFVAYTFQ